MSSQEFDSTKTTVAAVKAVNTSTPTPGIVGSSIAIEGQSDAGFGVYGHSINGRGVVAESNTNYGLRATSVKLSGIRSSSAEGTGVEGAGAVCGVTGGSSSKTGTGVLGLADAGTAVAGRSNTGPGMHGASGSGIAVAGRSDSGPGVHGASGSGIGIIAESDKSIGLRGTSNDSIGVWGSSVNHEGIHAETRSGKTAALAVFQLNRNSDHPAIYAKHDGGRLAAFFEGSVVITGDISMNHGDCAEDFTIAAGSSAEPGAVMVLDDEGNLRESASAYDKRVAGVISGAGSFKPGIVLDRQQTPGNRKPVALLGKVFCKADAQYGPIGVGDLLTTSPTPGCAMRVDDPLKAFGAVIGKALRPLAVGQGLIPILITLQ